MNETDRIVIMDGCGNRIWDVRYFVVGWFCFKKGCSVILVGSF